MNESAPISDLKEKIGKGVRLASLDFYRGLIMILLCLEACGLYENLLTIMPDDSFGYSVATQFTHKPWHGLHLWDFVQPAFMFIAGVALSFSLTRQTEKGRSWNLQFKQAFRRSGWLFFWGVLDVAVVNGGLQLDLVNVLTQLSFTLLLAFLIFRWNPSYQILLSLGLLILAEVLYRYAAIPGFDQPFTDKHNFGNYVDFIILGRINSDGWVSINCLPTAAHTIWGAVAGRWLLTRNSNRWKLLYIIALGMSIMIIGYSLDVLKITPIIKRIATSSFTLVTGGWCLLLLAFLYYWIDILNRKKYLTFFNIVGMNSLFIYLFFEIVVRHWLFDYSNTIVSGVLLPVGFPLSVILIVESLVLFVIQWSICYWLYKKKIFFKAK